MSKRCRSASERFAFLLGVLLLLANVVVESAVGPSLSLGQLPSVRLDPTVEYLGPHKTTTVWQIPPGKVRRVLFIAIASGSLPWDYWDRTPSCPLCRGLPELRRIVLDALGERYAVVLISPLDPGSSWDAWPRDSADLENAVLTLRLWKRAHGLENTSTVALGASAGGHALSTLGLEGPRLFEAMAIMVSKGLKQAWGHVKSESYPATLFVHCPRDSKTAEAILEVMSDLRAKGIPADEIKWLPHPITPTWFSQMIPGLDPPTSRAIFDAFKDEGGILDENDYLLSDVFDWQKVVRARGILPSNPEHRSQLLHKAAIEEEIKVAFAMHSALARRNAEIFRWFDGDYDVRPEES